MALPINRRTLKLMAARRRPSAQRLPFALDAGPSTMAVMTTTTTCLSELALVGLCHAATTLSHLVPQGQKPRSYLSTLSSQSPPAKYSTDLRRLIALPCLPFDVTTRPAQVVTA